MNGGGDYFSLEKAAVARPAAFGQDGQSRCFGERPLQQGVVAFFARGNAHCLNAASAMIIRPRY